MYFGLAFESTCDTLRNGHFTFMAKYMREFDTTATLYYPIMSATKKSPKPEIKRMYFCTIDLAGLS